MGLTIHYTLHAPAVKTAADAHRLVAALHTFAQSLPFQSVSDILTFTYGTDDPIIRILYTHHVIIERPNEEPDCYFAKPLELIFFLVEQDGSEPAVFGLGRYEPVAWDFSDTKTIPSDLDGWRFQRFCKTQYASLANHGGFPNFFTIHDGICQILRHAQSLAVTVDVLDESNYWTHQNPDRLHQEIDRWNHMIATLAGSIQDATDPATGKRQLNVEAPILSAPDFEHLEAKGQHFLRQNPQVHILRNLEPPNPPNP